MPTNVITVACPSLGVAVSAVPAAEQLHSLRNASIVRESDNCLAQDASLRDALAFSSGAHFVVGQD